MTRERREFPMVNKPEETVNLPTASLFVHSVTSTKSPIDEYYARTKEILIRSGKPDIQSDLLLMRLFLIETIASVELYFRRILARLVNICPIVGEKVNGRTVHFRAALYYSREFLGFALLEHASLSDSEAVTRLTKEITDLDIKPSTSIGCALADYDKICNLRHSAAHACGEVGANNISWHKPFPEVRLCIKIQVLELQSIVAIAHNIVRAYNRFMFEATFSRWKKRPVLTNSWATDRELFEKLLDLFYSTEDAASISSEEFYRRCLAVSNTSV